MPLGKNATAGDYVKDFRKSKAPQFKGKSKEKRHQMAIAAYLDKRDDQKEAKLSGNNLKLFGQENRPKTFAELSMKLKARAKLARGLRGPSQKARPDWMRDTGKRAKEIAKRARGEMARFLIQNRIENIKGIEDFSSMGFKFKDFEDNTFTFIAS